LDNRGRKVPLDAKEGRECRERKDDQDWLDQLDQQACAEKTDCPAQLVILARTEHKAMW
jgi:hypothetical protein